ncbi:MAG: transcriptional repressor [Saprospiraceae bacterium]
MATWSKNTNSEKTWPNTKSPTATNSDHLICVDCGKVLEFCDPRIQQIKNMMGDLLKFKVTHHSLNLYGQCDGI